MRLWSVHPKYLDPIGLVALWRESLLARKVLEGKTKGYKNHPQLIRFRKSSQAIQSINDYLNEIYEESLARSYKFDNSKLEKRYKSDQIYLHSKQLSYEFEWLKQKVQQRNTVWYEKIKTIKKIEPNPIFKIIKGDVENWEKC